MKPVLIVGGKRAEYNPDRNKITMQFLFPKQEDRKEETGEVVLINGDVPRIIVKAGAQVQVDRLEPEPQTPPGKRLTKK